MSTLEVGNAQDVKLNKSKGGEVLRTVSTVALVALESIPGRRAESEEALD